MDDVERAAGLRRMKVVATGLFLAAAIVYILARTLGDGDGAVGYVEAFAEAAMVGALADWFAVTALFRHPLGIPIPHTAIVPRRKAEIGAGLGEFVENNFLNRELVVERLHDADIPTRAANWLGHPENSTRLAEALADAAGGLLDVLDDDEIQAAVERIVDHRIRSTPAAPLAARILEVSVEQGHHQRLLDAVLTGLGGFLDDNRLTFRRRLDEESPWWVPESIDDRIFEKIYTAVQRFMDDVGADPQHEVRATIDARLLAFVDRLRNDPELAATAESYKNEVLEHPEVRAWIASLWHEAKTGLTRVAAEPDGEFRRRLAAALGRFGDRLHDEPELRRRMDAWLERGVLYAVDHTRGGVGNFIGSTVERWDPDTTSRRMEQQVGRDLQFIRINGTIVGGLAGVLIHLTGELLA
jgi:uncharacterized membrane-anchored protein YjiN (DUF445 family)